MKRFLILPFLAVCLGFFSCSNEIDLTAPYRNITVVYGLLDAREDTHWVRINKAFLGDGNALEYAQISDSLYYDSLVVYVLRFNASNQLIDSLPLEEVIDPFPKDGGPFAFDKNILYRFTGTLNASYRHQLGIYIPSKDTTVTADTKLCGNFFIDYPGLTTTLNVEPAVGNVDQPINIVWTKDPNSGAYQVGMRFKYQEWEVGSPGNVENKMFTYNFPLFGKNPATGNFAPQNLSGTNMIYAIEKASFYNAIRSRIPADPAGTPANEVHFRRFTSVDIVIYQAADELFEYISINAPSNSIVQKVNSYTNVDNGLGIFSSRGSKSVIDLQISTRSKDSLRFGQYTSHLNFQL